jgi:hypothetical protein
MAFVIGRELRNLRRAISELAGAHGVPVNQSSSKNRTGYAQALHR